MDLVSLYFRLLWYHSILRSSIDRKHAKTHDTKFEDKTVKPTQLSLVLVGLHDFQIFPDRTAHAWSVEGKHMFGLSLFCPSPQSPRRAKKDSDIPSPGRTSSVKCPTPGPTTTIKSPPHPSPPCPAGIILRVHWSSVSLMSAKRCNITGVLYKCLQSVSGTRDNSGGSRGGTRGPGLPVYL